MGDTDRRFGFPAEIVVAGLVLAAAIPLHRLFRPGRLTGVVLVAIGLSLLTSWGTRRLRFPPLLAWFVSMLSLLWWVSLAFHRDSLWGPFPSAETFDQLGTAIRVGIRRMIEEASPVPPTDELLLFAAAGVWVTTWLVEAAALWIRNPLLAIACAVPMWAIPGAIEPSRHRVIELLLFGGSAGALLFLDQSERIRRLTPKRPDARSTTWRAGSAARITAVALAVVAIVAPQLPGFGAPPGFTDAGRDSGSKRISINPLVAIKPTLDNDRITTLFTVRASRPTYYRLTALDNFDGKVWTEGPREQRRVSGRFDSERGPSATVELDQTFRMEALAGDWLPAAFDPIGVAAPAPVSLEEPTRALKVAGGLRFGTIYTVRSRVPRPEAELLDKDIDYDERALRRYLSLPRSVPGVVRDIARDVTRNQDTPFRKAVALQDYLRTFEYDQRVAAGHSFDTIEEFLTETKAGYCEQFAASMAVLARTLGIPARVAIGFGRGIGIADNVYEITTEEAHAWVEIYFPDAGWLAFEPTPRSGVTVTPSYAQLPESATDPTPTASAEPTPSATESAAAPSASPTGGDEAGGGARSGARSLLLFLAVVIGALGVAAIVLRLAPKVARGRAHDEREAVAGRYADLLAWYASVGIPRAPGQTPYEHATAVGAAVPGAQEPAAGIATMVEEALWAPPNGMDPAAFDPIAEQVRAAIRETLPPARRVAELVGWGRWRAWVGRPRRLGG